MTDKFGVITEEADGSPSAAVYKIKVPNGTLSISSSVATLTYGTGDVSGPASSTNGNLAAFDGTGGKTLKDSGYTMNQGVKTTDSPQFAGLTSPTWGDGSNFLVKWDTNILKFRNAADDDYVAVGIDSINDINDVDTSNVGDNDKLAYDSGTSTFKKENPIYCYAYLNSAQDDIAQSTDVKIALDASLYDPYSMFASNKITVPQAGIYMITGSLRLASLADGNLAVTNVYVNGARIGMLWNTRMGSAGAAGSGGSIIYQLAANDYVELYVYTNGSGVDLYTGSDNTFLSVYRLGPIAS